MKNLLFQEIAIISNKERRAIRETLDPKKTIVLGANSTGKSTFVNSLFYAFTAKPARTSEKWKGAQASVIVSFSVDQTTYKILRKPTSIGIFDNNNNPLLCTDDISRARHYLLDLFDFNLTTRTKDNITIKPPASFCFAPFYIGQESGWYNQLSSFQLNFIKNWKKTLTEYHTGIKPNLYYELLAVLEEVNAEISTKGNELKLLKAFKEKLQSKLITSHIAFTFDQFQNEVHNLKTRLNAFEKVKYEKALQISELQTRKIELESQLRLAQRAKIEITSDHKHADQVHTSTSLACPTCGAEYRSDITNHFCFIRDIDRCEQLIDEISSKLCQLNNKINEHYSSYKEIEIKYEELQLILDEQRDNITLKDMLRSKSKDELQLIFQDSLEELGAELDLLLSKSVHIESRLSHFESKEHKKKIIDFFNDIFKKYSIKLDYDGIINNKSYPIDLHIKADGSRLPRAMLAYHYSLFMTIREFGKAILCPLVIDSPNQQSQDKANLNKIFGFIFENTPREAQLILAAEDLYNFKPEAKVITLKNKSSLLSESGYEEAWPLYRELSHHIDSSLLPNLKLFR